MVAVQKRQETINRKAFGKILSLGAIPKDMPKTNKHYQIAGRTGEPPQRLVILLDAAALNAGGRFHPGR